jgi:hypothetical protein
VFAHFINANDFKHLTLKRKDQSIETCDIYSVLPCTIPFQGMASQPGQFHHLLNIPRVLDRVDAQDISFGGILTIRLNGLPIFPVAAFQLPGPENNDQRKILLESRAAR